MKIGFLLGAGVSLPAGMPSTEQLTTSVLCVENYQLNEDENFGRLNSGKRDGSWPDKKVLLELLLKDLHHRCKDYFNKENKSRTVNYEDIFFAASQLEEHLLEEYENPAIEPLTRLLLNTLKPALQKHLSKSVPHALEDQSDGVQLRIELRELAGLVCHYIRSVIMLELRGEPPSPGHLKCLVDAMSDRNLDACDIFTLNHDLLIERALHERKLVFVDGFGTPENDMAEWDASTFDRPSRHYFLKLHGSINWVDHPVNGLVQIFRRAWEQEYDLRGDPRFDRQASPKMLIGTFNKIRDYYGKPYFDLAATFRRQLKTLNWLVVSGYSFGDKGINTAICDLMDSQAGNILVLHERGAHCLERARGAIRQRRGQIRFCESYLCGSKWEDLSRTYIFPGPPTEEVAS